MAEIINRDDVDDILVQSSRRLAHEIYLISKNEDPHAVINGAENFLLSYVVSMSEHKDILENLNTVIETLKINIKRIKKELNL